MCVPSTCQAQEPGASDLPFLLSGFVVFSRLLSDTNFLRTVVSGKGLKQFGQCIWTMFSGMWCKSWGWACESILTQDILWFMYSQSHYIWSWFVKIQKTASCKTWSCDQNHPYFCCGLWSILTHEEGMWSEVYPADTTEQEAIIGAFEARSMTMYPVRKYEF